LIAVSVSLKFNNKTLATAIIISKAYMDMVFYENEEKENISIMKEYQMKEILIASLYLSSCLYEIIPYGVKNIICYFQSMGCTDKLNIDRITSLITAILRKLNGNILYDVVLNMGDDKLISSMTTNYCYLLVLLIDDHIGDIEKTIVYLKLDKDGKGDNMQLKTKVKNTANKMMYFKCIFKDSVRELIGGEAPFIPCF